MKKESSKVVWKRVRRVALYVTGGASLLVLVATLLTWAWLGRYEYSFRLVRSDGQLTIGAFPRAIIVDRTLVGLVPASEPHRLSRGEAARFRVSRILPDGRIDLTLRAPAHEEIVRDAERVLGVLSGPGAPQVNDRSSPEEIRQRFGLAKKAFKRAAGRLLKERTLEIDPSGFYRPLA